ncbi:hypothetical protein PPERSA_03424 [Pseudocohnilembus persalinus]|uniref:Uncharacterized protein n=1 Tax=Pseudocohnilembus persalinus TaxID=266149 RepID=A0A0V0QC04_PSEPJ|nr:hypothetical protein PPERSA_03424 [Pseudocohnilembus persalinus]|eukprot:KRW99623.1 hypothetical protein PPERSA_03424 [Pseudocohnilembus persalinus]
MEATLGRQNNLFNKEFYTKNEEISNASSQQAPSQFGSFEDLDKASINNNNNSNNLSVNNNINNYSLNDLQKNLQYSNNSQLFGANNQLNQNQNNNDGNNKQLQQQQLIKQNDHMMQPSFLQFLLQLELRQYQQQSKVLGGFKFEQSLEQF